MIIFWRGLGILVPVIFLASFILIPKLSELIFSKENGLSKSDITLISVVFSVLAILMLGYFANYKKRIVEVNSLTGRKIKSPSHTFFFIPIEYWAFIIVLVIYGVPYLPKP